MLKQSLQAHDANTEAGIRGGLTHHIQREQKSCWLKVFNRYLLYLACCSWGLLEVSFSSFFLSQNCYKINWRILKTLSLFDQKIDSNQTASNLANTKELQGALQNEKTLIAIKEWEQARCMSQISGLVIAKPTLGNVRGLSGRLCN